MATAADQVRPVPRRWGAHALILLAMAGGGVLLKATLDQRHERGWFDGTGIVLLVYWGSLAVFGVLSTLLRWRRVRPVRTYLFALVISPPIFIWTSSTYEEIQATIEGRKEEKRYAAARDSLRLERWWQRIDRSAGRVEVGAVVRAQRDCSLGFSSELGLGPASAPPSAVHAARPKDRPAAEPIRSGEMRTFAQSYPIAADEEVRGTSLYLSCDSVHFMFDSDVVAEQPSGDRSITLPLPAPSP